MSIHGELSDREVLHAATESLSGLPVASPPDIAMVMARGRAHRAHRARRTRRTRRLAGTAGLSVAGAAAGTALALSLAGVPSTAPAPSTGPIRTAAFTLTSNPDGTATLTLNVDELLNTSALQSDLTKNGIPAKVTSGSFCSSDPAPDGFSRAVVLKAPWSPDPPAGGTVTPPADQPTITVTIDPAAIPAGAALSVGDFRTASGQQKAFLSLIDTSAFTCSSTPDGQGAAMTLLLGGPAVARS